MRYTVPVKAGHFDSFLQVLILKAVKRDCILQAKVWYIHGMITASEIRGYIGTYFRYRLIQIKHRPLRTLVIFILLVIPFIVLRWLWKAVYPMSADVWWKVIGYAGIPSVMAWAGLHLAADIVKSKKIKFMFRALFVCLAALGIILVAVVEKKSEAIHKDEVDYQRKQYEYQRDQNTLMTQKLDTGQAAATLLAQQFGDFRKDLKSMVGRRTSANPRGPTINASDILKLEQRAEQAENNAKLLSTFYGQELKIKLWPFGAAGANHPGLHKWFLTNFPEADDLNGQDRFFLYYMIKHGGELGVDGLKELQDLYNKEFPGIISVLAVESKSRLEKFGFIEDWTHIPPPRRMDLTERLKEPYFSRFKNVQVP